VIPLRDTIRSRHFPIVNSVLIGINVLVFLFESVMSPEQQSLFLGTWGLTPARFWQAGGLGAWAPLFTSVFLHAGWWHLISNMLALYIFGDNIEDELGPVRYLVFYLLSGTVAGAAHLLTNSGSQLPTVGASGAIAGVLGAYIILYPHARIVTLVPVFYFVRLIQIPAVIYLGFWIVSQLFNGVLALGGAGGVSSGGVAWWAHIGGFLFGMVVIRLLVPRRRPPAGGYRYV